MTNNFYENVITFPQTVPNYLNNFRYGVDNAFFDVPRVPMIIVKQIRSRELAEGGVTGLNPMPK